MMVTVNPCFHWVGYHITRGLLQEGVEVIGIDPIIDEKSDLLYMFVGRNSNFQHFFQEYDKENYVQKAENEITVEYVEDFLLIKKAKEKQEWLELPKLYGEWMDLDRYGLQGRDSLMKWIEINDAIYIEDFFEDFYRDLLQEDPIVVKKAER
ncbi:hypothetical protein SAMN04487936_103206 [Halobacillus dabanensis]|uniref:Uncharacterized protein n=1 Tax=Halobacillus dabanensis TaxID=240302 RepID=A0A1I3T6R9_HALDA|nr:hypothetical protein [Halobacillus dabanensis]SFJ65366.1 hypothetical protein SAMN04487936_103206 [Halobacillus dabanensis]